MKTLLALAAFAVTISAQDAIVVDIALADATKMMTLYDQQKNIEAEIAKERKRIGLKYATWQDTGITTLNGEKVPPEYDFSQDFKHIVPKQNAASSPASGPLFGYGGPCFHPAKSTLAGERTFSSTVVGLDIGVAQ